MKKKSPKASPRKAPAAKAGKTARNAWVFRLYVAGQTPRSLSAYANLQKMCEQHLPGRYRIDVIDLVKHPELGKTDQIVALPTLVRRLPVPVKRLIGDLANSERVMLGIELALANQP